MAKATAPNTTTLSVPEAAAAVVHLINVSPRSPRLDEIEAIIAKVVGASPPSGIAIYHDRWWAHVQRWIEALAEADVLEDHPHKADLDAANERACEALEALEQQIWEKSIDDARNFADIRLLADMLVNQGWPGLTPACRHRNQGDRGLLQRQARGLSGAALLGDVHRFNSTDQNLKTGATAP